MSRIKIDDFLADFDNARSRAKAVDATIMNAASNISSNYVDLVSLATRQTMGALEITVGADAKGTPDPSDVMVFMEDIGTSRCAVCVNVPWRVSDCRLSVV